MVMRKIGVSVWMATERVDESEDINNVGARRLKCLTDSSIIDSSLLWRLRFVILGGFARHNGWGVEYCWRPRAPRTGTRCPNLGRGRAEEAGEVRR